MKKRLHQKLALLCSLALMAGSIPATGLMPACALEAEEAVQMSEELPAEAPGVSAEGEALPEAEPWLPRDCRWQARTQIRTPERSLRLN